MFIRFARRLGLGFSQSLRFSPSFSFRSTETPPTIYAGSEIARTHKEGEGVQRRRGKRKKKNSCLLCAFSCVFSFHINSLISFGKKKKKLLILTDLFSKKEEPLEVFPGDEVVALPVGNATASGGGCSLWLLLAWLGLRRGLLKGSLPCHRLV
jgi:hypothetical protein